MSSKDNTAVHITDKTAYWDERFSCQVVKLLPGEYYVSSENEIIATVLGSCIAVCLYERVLGLGGMNHFLLPYEQSLPINPNVNESSISQLAMQTKSPRYGNFAMMYLINEIIKRGGLACNLEAKIFGGGHVTQSSNDIGSKNIEFVKSYLASERIEIVGENIGGNCPRKLYFQPSTNMAFVKSQTIKYNL